MRNLRRNTQLVWYSKQEDAREILDTEGNRTGQYEPVWSALEWERLYVSPGGGDAELTLFGRELRYDRVMSTSRKNCPIEEDCVLWVDADPVDDPCDYIVVSRARWKNSVLYAIRKVDVNEAYHPNLPEPGEPGEGDPGDSELPDLVPEENPGAQ